MYSSEPRDVLIECSGCGIENQFASFTPGNFLVCNQCREKLLHASIDETHKEYVCEDCGFTMILNNDTKVEIGESDCKCGSKNIIEMESSSLTAETLEIEARDEEEELDEDDWYRSGTVIDDLDDYNNLFDNDPGSN